MILEVVAVILFKSKAREWGISMAQDTNMMQSP